MKIKDLYCELKKVLVKKIRKENNYLTIVVFIENDNGEILLQRKSLENDSKWATIIEQFDSNQNSLEKIVTEINKKLGVTIDKKELKLFKTIKTENDFADIYYLNKNISLKDMIIQKEKFETLNWFKKEQINGLITKRLFMPSHIDFYKYFIEYKSR